MNPKEIVEQCENEGRTLFASYLDQENYQYEGTTDPSDPIDMIVTNKKDKKIAVEIKTRTPYYEQFPTYFLEEMKYKGMKKRMKEIGAKVGLYVCIFGTHIYIYNIEDIVSNTPITYRKLPKNSFGGELVDKAIYDFDKTLVFKKIQLDNDKWIKL